MKEITKIMSETKYKFPLTKGDKSIQLVDIRAAGSKIEKLFKGEIIKAFQAGQEWGENQTLFNNTDKISRSEYEATADLEEYLKLKGYEQ